MMSGLMKLILGLIVIILITDLSSGNAFADSCAALQCIEGTTCVEVGNSGKVTCRKNKSNNGQGNGQGACPSCPYNTFLACGDECLTIRFLCIEDFQPFSTPQCCGCEPIP